MNATTKLYNAIVLKCYNEYDSTEDDHDLKLVIAGVVAVDGAIVLLVCNHQADVSLSSLIGRFTAASHVGCELLGLQ